MSKAEPPKAAGISMIAGKRMLSEQDYFVSKGMVPVGNRQSSGIENAVSYENFSSQPYVSGKCEMLKKDGSACNAPPIKSRSYCVGHERQLEKGNATI